MRQFEFKEEEIPYAVLEQFGLSQEMVEDLSTEAYEDILRGRRSPVLPVAVKDAAGNTVRARTRFKLIRGMDEAVGVVFHPRLVRCDLDRYTPEEQEALSSGKAIISHAPDDESVKCFVQVDTETNQVLWVPTPVIGRNLSNLTEHFGIASEDVFAIQEGALVMLREDGEDVTVGIYLTERSGLRVVLGGPEEWLKDKGESDMGRYTFGICGCWVRDAEGNLGYVHEQDYTDEIWAEQEKAIARNSGMKR